MQNLTRGKHATEQRISRIFLGMSVNGPLICAPEICALVLGPPRSGKTTSIIIPNILVSRGSVISISTKFDVFEATYRLRKKIGRCVVFDPTEALVLPNDVDRVGWSPLDTARSWERAVLSAEAMVGASHSRQNGESSHWHERASALLSSLFHAAALDESPMDRVVQAVNRREAEPFVEVLARHDANFALDVLIGIRETDAREQSGIWSTAAGVLAGYRTGAALRSTHLEPIDWESFLSEVTTLYIASPTDHQQHIAPLIAGLLRDLRSHSYSRVAHNQAIVQSNVLLILDELANIAPLHDLPALIAEGASQGIVTLASLQDLSQARARWGTAGEGFLSLFGAKVILGGIGDRTTLSHLSVLAGDHYVRSVSHSRSRRLGRWVVPSSQISSVRQPRLAPSDIATPPPGQATAIIGARAYRCSLVPYFLKPSPSNTPQVH